MAKIADAKITFIHVVEKHPYHNILYGSVAAEQKVKEEIKAAVQKWFAQIKDMCTERGMPLKLEILFDRNSIAESIISYSKEDQIDLIVVGHRGAHGFEKLLMGSVTKGVIDCSPCSVLVVKK